MLSSRIAGKPLRMSKLSMSSSIFPFQQCWAHIVVVLSKKTLEDLAQYCEEFLIHAVDVEGKRGGIHVGQLKNDRRMMTLTDDLSKADLVTLLGKLSPIPVTYAGGAQDLVRYVMTRWIVID